jgi:hypothetical protein
MQAAVQWSKGSIQGYVCGNKEAESFPLKLQSSKYLLRTNTHTGSRTDKEMAEADTGAFSNELYLM